MIRTSHRIITATVIALSVIVAGCAERSVVEPPAGVPATTIDASAATVTVAVQGFLFQDGDLEIEAGTTVRWENQDRILHTVTAGTEAAPSGLFDIQLDGDGSSGEFTFSSPGTYEYFCARHPHMTGTITVTP